MTDRASSLSHRSANMTLREDASAGAVGMTTSDWRILPRQIRLALAIQSDSFLRVAATCRRAFLELESTTSPDAFNLSLSPRAVQSVATTFAPSPAPRRSPAAARRPDDEDLAVNTMPPRWSAIGKSRLEPDGREQDALVAPPGLAIDDNVSRDCAAVVLGIGVVGDAVTFRAPGR